MLERIRHFLTETLWRLDSAAYPRRIRLLLRPLRFCVLVAKAYVTDRSILHASALTYITMLAIVPVLTLGMTSLKAFGAGELAREKVMQQIDYFVGEMSTAGHADKANAHLLTVPKDAPATTPSAPPPAKIDHPEPLPAETSKKDTEQAKFAANALRDVCTTVFDHINSINFAKIGIIGAVVLIFIVISVLGKIENSFNAIWHVRKSRKILKKLTDYISVIVIVPLLALSATTLPILESISGLMPSLGWLGTIIEQLGVINTLIPLLLGTLLFTFLFKFLPNTNVRLTSGLLGAFITTVVLVLFFRLCMVLQVGISGNSSLYGSLVALPILLFWIFSSWEIILLGAEVCYVHQHRTELLREEAFNHPSRRDIIVLALALVFWAARNVEEDRGPVTVEEFADTFLLPQSRIDEVVGILETRGILAPVAGDNDSTQPVGYLLKRCATRLRVVDVINACLDDTPGEEVIRRADARSELSPLTVIGTQFTKVLDDNFSLSVAETLRRAQNRGGDRA